MAKTKTEKTKITKEVTAEDLEMNPELKDQGVSEGDSISIEEEAIEREEDTRQEDDKVVCVDEEQTAPAEEAIKAEDIPQMPTPEETPTEGIKRQISPKAIRIAQNLVDKFRLSHQKSQHFIEGAPDDLNYYRDQANNSVELFIEFGVTSSSFWADVQFAIKNHTK